MTMTKIFKYQTNEVQGVVEFSMPAKANVLSAQSQNDRVCIWAQVEEFRQRVTRRFLFVLTGHNMDSKTGGRFVGTCQLDNGAFIVHVFDLGEVNG